MQNTTNNTFLIIAVITALAIGAVVLYSGGLTTSPESIVISDTSDTAVPADTIDDIPVAVATDEIATADELDSEDDIAKTKDETPAVADAAETDVASVTLEPVAPPSSTPTATFSGTFSDYDESKLVAGETNILFFHANWCPSCRGLENDLNANLSAIPAGVNILKLDYDSETELKKEYKVIRQHTLVVVDGNGIEIKKLTGLTNTLDQVVNQL